MYSDCFYPVACSMILFAICAIIVYLVVRKIIDWVFNPGYSEEFQELIKNDFEDDSYDG